jgi:hypothetical protein
MAGGRGERAEEGGNELCKRTGQASMSIFKNTASGVRPAISSTFGPTARHGPHHVAVKYITTSRSPAAANLWH